MTQPTPNPTRPFGPGMPPASAAKVIKSGRNMPITALQLPVKSPITAVESIISTRISIPEAIKLFIDCGIAGICLIKPCKHIIPATA